ncbi:MAG: hypothetical protein GC205_01805 [Bacteroidetes bacterium]|nr:hypothetical protein [Bacteroidota bacterium]
MRAVSLILFSGLAFMASFRVNAQPCNPANPSQNLTSAFTAGTGALLQWEAVEGSFGLQIRATAPSGAAVSRRIVGFERSQFLVPEALLAPGDYTWQVQAACSPVPPYAVTPISVLDTFTVAAPITCPATVMDVDGNIYPVVAIGTQCWMQETLKTRHYQNGDSILSELSDPFWSTLTVGSAAYPDGLYHQDLQYATNATSRFDFLKREGYSVRCLQD